MRNILFKGKGLFLIDGVGALISAFFLGIVLTNYENYFGMPVKVLYLLALIACAFSIYSICCYFLVYHKWPVFLKAIALLNSAYCLLTIGLVLFFYQRLTILGVLYFLIELIIVVVLISLELKTVYVNQKKSVRP